MKVIEQGYRYEVETANKMPAFDIVFCRNANGEFQDGITNEELINIMIDRMRCMVKKNQSQENMNTLTHLQQAKEWLEKRRFGKLIKRKNETKNDIAGNGILVPAKS